MRNPRTKPIKFDLPIDGTKVATVDQLRGHFTTEILGHFRKGVLVNWLRARRGLEKELAAVEALPKDGDDRTLLMALCKAFAIDADEHSVAAALDVTGVPGMLVSRQITESSESSVGRLLAGGEYRWRLDVFAVACVTIEVDDASMDMFVALEDERGLQIATDGAFGEGKRLRLKAILSKGTYYIRLRGFDDKSSSNYILRVNQAQEFTSLLHDSEMKVSLKDLMTDQSLNKSKDNGDDVYEVEGSLAKDRADIWIIDMPQQGAIADVRAEGDLDTVGYLLDPIGRILKKDSYSGSSLNFHFISPCKLSGKFAILVRGFANDEIGGYRLQVTAASSRPEVLAENVPEMRSLLFPTCMGLAAFLAGIQQTEPEPDHYTVHLVSTGLKMVLAGTGMIDIHKIPEEKQIFGWLDE